MPKGIYVTISRHWNSPKITTTITDEEIGLQMDMEDFRKALKSELGNLIPFREALKEKIGSVTWVMKKATIDKRIDEGIDAIKEETIDNQIDNAIDRVISGIKEESAKVVCSV